MSLIAAREKWAEFKTILAEGRDPFVEGEEGESGVTIRDLCDRFVTEYCIGPDRENPRNRTLRETKRILDYDLVSDWGDRTVISITDDVQDLLYGIIDRGCSTVSREIAYRRKRRKADSISAYVFPAPRSSGPVAPTLVARHLRRFRDELKIPDGFSTHGLPHTALTQIAILGYGKHIRDRISNHKDISVDAVYQHHEYDEEARECWQAWADRLDALGADNVTPLKGGRRHGS